MTRPPDVVAFIFTSSGACVAFSGRQLALADLALHFAMLDDADDEPRELMVA